MKVIDCQGLAGAWTLGTVQAGFELVHRTSLPGGFGDAAIDHNRHLVGDGWEQETGPQDEWTPQEADYLCGTPPCSGFSLLNISKGSNARGVDSTINNCMKELIGYAARCTGPDGLPGVPIVAFESVQGAYTQGRPLMQTLRERLERKTGQHYDLTHVKMSGASVGAAQIRKRYYPVFHRVPFGVEPPRLEDLPDGRIVTYRDAIGDLAGGRIQWEEQRYPRKPLSSFAAEKREGQRAFTDHVPLDFKKKSDLVLELYERGWPRGMSMPSACINLGYRPDVIEKAWDPEKERYRGFRWPRRIRPDRPGYVITGGSGEYLHWDEPRSLTIRELTRLMGYPDAWLWPDNDHKRIAPLIGKCCPVDSGRWISTWVRSSLEGSPGTGQEPIGDREFLHDCTNLYKTYPGADVPPIEEAA